MGNRRMKDWAGKEFGAYRPDKPLADQLNEMLHKWTEIEPDEES